VFAISRITAAGARFISTLNGATATIYFPADLSGAASFQSARNPTTNDRLAAPFLLHRSRPRFFALFFFLFFFLFFLCTDPE
jgi:hypothetical protein